MARARFQYSKGTGLWTTNTCFHERIWQGAPHELVPHEPCDGGPPDGNRGERLLKTTGGVPSADLKDIAASATSLAITYSITTFDHSAVLLYLSGIRIRHSMVRFRQSLDGVSDIARTSHVFLRPAAPQGLEQQCYGA